MSKNQDPKRSWNVMVYLAGENNLAEECVYALKEMKRARPRHGLERKVEERVKVIAQLDASGLGGRESRYILSGSDVDGDLSNCVIATRDTSETTYRSVLRDFISTSIVDADGDGLARYYMLVLSGHGHGVASSDFLSRDVEAPDTLSIPKIQWVLQQVRADVAALQARRNGAVAGGGQEPFRINVLGLDSCLMSMAEIGYELREYVDFMVGAEGFEPNTGWPYQRILSDILSNDETLEPRRLAESIVSRYVTYYSDFLPAGRSVDQAANDLSVMRDRTKFVARMKKLSDVLKAKLDDPEAMRHILLAHWEAQSYKDDQYVDLYDFCDLLDRGPHRAGGDNETGSVILRGATIDEYIVEACRDVKAVLKDKPGPVVLKSCYSGPAVQHSHGLSIYFPWADVIETYRDLEFARDTGWQEFLLSYVDKTRRGLRTCPGQKHQTPLKSMLSFNPRMSGFDFLPVENKDVPLRNRVLGNKVGTMKNPALDHVPCDCRLPKAPAGEAAPDEKRAGSGADAAPGARSAKARAGTKRGKNGGPTPKT